VPGQLLYHPQVRASFNAVSFYDAVLLSTVLTDVIPTNTSVILTTAFLSCDMLPLMLLHNLLPQHKAHLMLLHHQLLPPAASSFVAGTGT
jgi:hypothetical protein